jgi:hypothetical protein
MATTFWTLVYAGTEKSFQDWGFTEPRLHLASQSQSTFTVRIPGATNLVAAPPIPFEGAIKIYRNRALGAGVYSGGEIVFQGKQVTRRGSANSENPADTLVFGDAFYDLERLVFQQRWNYGAAPNTTYFSRLNLFQRYDLVTGISAATNGAGVVNITLALPMILTTGDYVTIVGVPGINAPVQATVVDATHLTVPGKATGVYGGGGSLWPDNQRITNGVQIQEIINFAATAGVAIQVGTIDLNYLLPIYPVRGVSCASAIQICIKPQPDASTWIDYTTTPPTFNCRARPNLTRATMPYADGVMHFTSEIIPRFDLVPPAVVLQYQKTSNVGGSTYNDFGYDAYPPGSTGLVPRSMVVPIDLRGANIQTLSIVVQANAMPNLPSGDAPSLAWWKLKKREMNAYGALTMVPGSLNVKDDQGNDLTGTWAVNTPNEYIKGEILSWMGVTVVQATITASFSYTENDPSARTWHTVTSTNPHQISVRVKLTNSPSGQRLYAATQSADPGELAPAGLAQTIYNSLQPLQYEGTHRVIDPGFNTVSPLVGPKNILQLFGGALEWGVMDSTVQSAEYDFFLSKAEINFGPVKHLTPGDLEELLQFWRWRTVYDNPNLRISAQQSQTQGSQVGGDTATENTTQGNAPASVLIVQSGAAATTSIIKHDAPNQQLLVQVVDAAGAALPTKSAISIALGDLNPGLGDTTVRTAKFQLFRFKDSADSCNPKFCYVLMTDPEPDV